jgi:tetratricopeptide (TPR) repeat protein
MGKAIRPVLAAILFFGLGTAGVQAYNDDTHFPFTYFMARACGYTPLQAYRLACACLSIDYAAETEAEQYHRVIPSSQDAQSPRVDFHAFMDSRRFPNCLSDSRQMQDALYGILKRRELFWEIARKGGNIGPFIHFVQDETAHFGYSSWGGHYASYGAYKNFKPLGSTCDFLSYGPPERHNEMINLVLQFLADFLKEPQFESGIKPRQKPRVPNRGEIMRLLNALRDVNPATEPLGAADALLVGAAWAAGGPLGGAAVAILDGWKAKRGPIMANADGEVEKALQAWGEIPVWKSGSRVFEDEPVIFDFDKGGHLRGDLDAWTLFGDLKVSLNGPVGPEGALVTVKAAPTRRKDSEEELARETAKGSQPVMFKMLPVGDVIIEVGRPGREPIRRTISLDKRNNEAVIDLPKTVRPAGKPPKIEILGAEVTPPEGKPGTFELIVSYRVVDLGPSDWVSVRKSTGVSGPEPVNFVDEFSDVGDGDRRVAKFDHFFHLPGDYVWNFKLEIQGAPPAAGKAPVRVTEMVYVLKKGSPQFNRTRVPLKAESGNRAGWWESRMDTIAPAGYRHGYRGEQAGQLKSELQFEYQFALPVVIVPSKGFDAAIAGRLTGRTAAGSDFSESSKLRWSYAKTNLEPQAIEGDDLFLGKRTEGSAVNTKQKTRFRLVRHDVPTLTIEIFKAAINDWPIATWTYELKWLPAAEVNALLGQNPPLPAGGGGGFTEIRPINEARDHNNRGNDRFKEEKWKEAEAEYREAVRLDSTSGVFRANLAGALLEQNRREEASAEAREAQRLGCKDHPIYRRLGLTGPTESADSVREKELRRNLAAAPDDADLHNRLGNLMFNGKRYREAETEYREAVRLRSDSGLFQANLAGALLRLNRREDAVPEARSAIAKGESKHWVIKELGLTDAGTGGTGGMGELGPSDIQRFRQAISLASQGADLMKAARWPEAEAKLREAVRLSPLADYLALLGQALGGQKKWAETEDAFRQALKEEPGKTVWWMNLGIAQEAQKKWAAAEESYRAAIRLDDKRGAAHADLAAALLGQGRKEEALAEAREAMRLGERNHPVFKRLGLQRRP